MSWWHRATIYQVYPRSFQDSDGDGVGDLAGIEVRLDHIAALGADALWLSPIYPSPLADFGYDVSDYQASGESRYRAAFSRIYSPRGHPRGQCARVAQPAPPDGHTR